MNTRYRLAGLLVLLSLTLVLAACAAKQDLGYLKTRPAAALKLPDGVTSIKQGSYMVIPDVKVDGMLPADDKPPRISGE